MMLEVRAMVTIGSGVEDGGGGGVSQPSCILRRSNPSPLEALVTI